MDLSILIPVDLDGLLSSMSLLIIHRPFIFSVYSLCLCRVILLRLYLTVVWLRSWYLLLVMLIPWYLWFIICCLLWLLASTLHLLGSWFIVSIGSFSVDTAIIIFLWCFRICKDIIAEYLHPLIWVLDHQHSFLS